jgi:hypothetical protein
MNNSKGTSTPLELGIKNNLSNIDPKENEVTNNFPDREAIGCLMYAMLYTRPDLGFPICYLSPFSNTPRNEHWIAVKRVLRYVKGTQCLRLVYKKDEINLLGYYDVDWAGDMDNRKSTSGFVFLLGGGAVSWGSRK